MLLRGPPVKAPSPPPTSSTATTPATSEPTQPSAPSAIAEAVTPDAKEESTSVTQKSVETEEAKEKEEIQVHQDLLHALTAFYTKDPSNEEVPLIMLKAMIPLANYMLRSEEGAGFRELMAVISQLAGSGRGHVQLLSAAVGWLEIM